MRFTCHDFQVQDAKRHYFFTGAAAGIIGALGSMAGSGMFSGKNTGRSYNDILYDVNMTNAQWRHDEYMANSAHKREVNDLRSAGLNPVLSATGGSGASAGSASAPVPAGGDLFGAVSKSAAADLAREQVNTQQQLQNTEREKQAMLYNQSWLLAETAKQMSNTNYVPNMYTARLQKNPKLRENAIDAYEAEHWRKGYGDLGGLTGIGKAVESSVRNLFR